MLSAFISSLRTADLRRKILFTLGLVILYRVGASIPSPGVNYPNVQKCIEQVSGGDSAQIYSLINLFSGAALVMWMGELVTERGVGNGMSILI